MGPHFSGNLEKAGFLSAFVSIFFFASSVVLSSIYLASSALNVVVSPKFIYLLGPEMSIYLYFQKRKNTFLRCSSEARNTKAFHTAAHRV